jgi:hypothetical protein
MKEFKAYQCGFCSKYGKQKSRILQHENTCFRNPKTKSCATCIHLKQKEYKTFTNEETPFGDENAWSDFIPVCEEGVDVSSITDSGEKSVQLKTQCPLWEDEYYKLKLSE